MPISCISRLVYPSIRSFKILALRFFPDVYFGIFPVLDSLVDPLQKTINFKPKQDAVKQEVDRNEDMIRSALRAIASLNRIRFAFQMHLVFSFYPSSTIWMVPGTKSLLEWHKKRL